MKLEKMFTDKALYVETCNSISTVNLWIQDTIDDYTLRTPRDRKLAYSEALYLQRLPAPENRLERNNKRWELSNVTSTKRESTTKKIAHFSLSIIVLILITYLIQL
jgi:hypothetical protein